LRVNRLATCRSLSRRTFYSVHPIIAMVEIVLLVAIGFLLLGVVGSVVPLLPSGLLSLAGVYAYVFFGEGSIHILILLGLTLAGVLAAVLEHFGGPLAAKASGASNQVVAAAAIAAVLLFFVAGPVGIVAGVLGVVFALEMHKGASIEVALKRALYTGGGILASTVMQLLLTICILLGFLLAVVVF